MEGVTQQSMKLKFIIAIFWGIMGHELSAATITIGEMVFKIQDAATGTPLSGVYVYRNMTTQYIPFSIFGIAVETKQIRQPSDCAISNNGGIAIFPKKIVPRKKNNEDICTMSIYLNFGFDKEIEPDDPNVFFNTYGLALQDGKNVFSKNGKNDAAIFSFITNTVAPEYRYEVLRSKSPKQEYVICRSQYIFSQPYKTIVIKLGNGSIVGTGIKTEVSFEEAEPPPVNTQD